MHVLGAFYMWRWRSSFYNGCPADGSSRSQERDEEDE